jgi:hypothetical protein
MKHGQNDAECISPTVALVQQYAKFGEATRVGFYGGPYLTMF